MIRHHRIGWVALLVFFALAVSAVPQTADAQCQGQVYAQVVAIDQPYFWNRLGAAQPHGQIFALKRDVVAISGSTPGPGNAMLRADKRPRPLVLRMNVGDCLTIDFTNWLNNSPYNDQPVTREASIHVAGMQLQSIDDDGSWVGKNNPGSLAGVGQTVTYRLLGQREGTYLMHSAGALTGGPEGDNGTISTGLFGAVNVEPAGSVWYRSQVTEEDFELATKPQQDWPTPSGLGQPSVHGFPVVDYNATYTDGTPILKMKDASGEIVHSDLTAIIAGPGPNGTIPNQYPEVEIYGDRHKPFREFTIIFHDEPGAVQAFRQFRDGEDGEPADPDGLGYTLHSVRDAFAINYGTGGIGAEILANRLGVGPMHDCVSCLYEEFFLSSWVVGDPAMVVDVPANAPCDLSDKELEEMGIDPMTCDPEPGPKATVAYYPDDPSNVYHSYQNDHVKFRNLLAGSDDHHIFHLHAHQWLHTPDSDEATYKDSQAIGQGTAFTYEIAHDGSGNRNKTPGDSIFHCHFYPHFAQGMWSMWRVHDVLEIGTPVDEEGKPLSGSRALPDGEIAAGTPIPALVPLPGQPMAPPPAVQVSINNGQVVLPGTAQGNPGYPFWIPGEAGQRVPAPPLDVYVDGSGTHHDGGLPRHIVNGGNIFEVHTRLDFTKEVTLANAYELADDGEPWEKEAMSFHADRFDGTQDGFMTTFKPDGSGTGLFEVNGSDERRGAPYAEPCYRPAETGYPNARRDLTYKAANIEMDVVFNKKGWHFPQQRFLSLWEDVDDFKARTKPPEPLFIRANSYDCVEYLHTNLVPKEYELDDFQVRTPTDVLGQHIHLVKFDVTSSDGSANGFNYEDGTLSPEEVVHLIDVINDNGGIFKCKNCRAQEKLTVENHPFFGVPGAQTTVQRWYVDNVLNKYSRDRTLRTVFTHDHFGPSTHQQVGLYAGLITEREGSLWFDSEDGSQLGFDLAGNPARHDGGPTSWQAVIEGPESFREFILEFGDFQHAYTRESTTYPDPDRAINPPGREQQWTQLASKPWIYEKPAIVGHCPDGQAPPCPEAVSADDPGTMVVNYRNEPIALRVKDPNSNTQAAGQQGDLSWAFASINRADPDLNLAEPNYGSTLSKSEEVRSTDPYTPLMRVYEDDPTRVRVLVGAHEEEHNFSIHGTRWLFEPEDPNSGYKSSQMMGISEFYDFEIPPLLIEDPTLAAEVAQGRSVDFLYKAGSSVDDLWNGIWGLIRVYRNPRGDLKTVSTNADAKAADVEEKAATYRGVCPPESLGNNLRPYNVFAITAADSLPEGRLLYNDRPGLPGTPLNDPTAMLFVHEDDLEFSAKMLEKYGEEKCAVQLKKSAPREPLILRAAAGECVEVRLTNCVLDVNDQDAYSLLPNIIDRFNQNQVDPSGHVGLHTQELTYDVARHDGVNVGLNPTNTVAPLGTKLYRWYAGINHVKAGQVVSEPVEFGSVALFSSDPIKHSNKGAVGALIVEPEDATWVEYPKSRAKAVVNRPASANVPAHTFREFVLVTQDDIGLRYGNNKPVRPLEVNEDAAETGQVAFNYRTEPVWFREGQAPENLFNIQLANTFSNTQVPSDPVVGKDPKTPVFHAKEGDTVRFRLIHPGGDSQQHTFGVHGHVFQEEPWVGGSTELGSNPLSEWKGVEYGHGPTNAFDAILENGAGGAFGVVGDFMYRDYASWYLANGLWGLMRVHATEFSLRQAEPAWGLAGSAEALNE